MFLVPLNIYVHLYCHICFALDVFTLEIVFLAHTVANFVVRKAFDERGRASGGVFRGERVSEMVRYKVQKR